MRYLTAALTIGGIPLGYFAGALLIAAIGAWTTGEQRDGQTVAYLVLSSTGFFVWVGWAIKAATGRYFVTPWIFWLVSVANHMGWAVILWTGSATTTGSQASLGGFGAAIVGWLIFNIGLGIVLCVLEFLEQRNARPAA